MDRVTNTGNVQRGGGGGEGGRRGRKGRRGGVFEVGGGDKIVTQTSCT